MFFLFLIFLIQNTVVFAQQSPNIELNIQPNEIWIGESAKLTWSVTNAKYIFISGVGKVTPAGVQYLKPTKTTSFTLIAESDKKTAFKTVTVKVNGGRGELDFPERRSFKYSKSYKASIPSLGNFVDKIYSVLQDSMGFNVDFIEDIRGDRIYLLTDRLQNSYIAKQQDDIKIAAWRIAFLVELVKPKTHSGEIVYFVKAVIEYKRIIEKKWRLENDKLIYNQSIGTLTKMIDQSFRQSKRF